MFAKKARISKQPPGPGTLLREKRIENGWTVTEVARALCLSGEHVEALEGDDYTHLPGGTYVLGYWKSYAALLGICIDQSVAAHRKHLRDTASGRMPEPEPRRLRKLTERSHHYLGFGFALLSGGFLLGIWYWQSPPPESLLNDSEWRTDNAYESNFASSEPSAGAADAEAALQGAAIPPTVPEPSFPEKNHSRSLDSEPGYEAGYQSLGADAGAAPPPPEKIVFIVNKESWLEVLDGAGKRLIHRSVPGGKRVTLEGRPPFSVFIGSVEGVAVHYRGEPVPFIANGDGLFARFNVGVR